MGYIRNRKHKHKPLYTGPTAKGFISKCKFCGAELTYDGEEWLSYSERKQKFRTKIK